MIERRDAPYPQLKKTHTMAQTGRPWTDYKPPAAAPVSRVPAMVAAMAVVVIVAAVAAVVVAVGAVDLVVAVAVDHVGAAMVRSLAVMASR